MARVAFIVAALIGFATAIPAPLRAQTPAPQAAQANDEIGNVASVEGSATVARNGASQGLKVQDPIFKGDVLRTGANATLGITFDDETTFNLSANSSITVDEFIYAEGRTGNAALFKATRGTIAFAAQQVAKTGDMKIETPSSTVGVRGTSGVIEVPEGATGSTGEVAVKLYPDQDGHVGRIELFGLGGGPRLGLLTRAATGFSLRASAGGRFNAVALTISPQQAARDRGFVQRAFAVRSIGRQMIIQRRNLRSPGLQRQPGGRPSFRQQPGLRQPGLRPNLPRSGALPLRQQQQRLQNGPAPRGQPRPPARRKPNERIPR